MKPIIRGFLKQAILDFADSGNAEPTLGDAQSILGKYFNSIVIDSDMILLIRRYGTPTLISEVLLNDRS